jgi:hypothetical protein
MNSEPTYVVIAIADGSGDMGPCIWSERFKTHAAAKDACAFLKRDDVRVRLIADGVYEPLAESVPPLAA